MTQKETFDFLKDYIDKKIDGSYDTIRDILTENKTKEVGENISSVNVVGGSIDNIKNVENHITEIDNVSDNISYVTNVSVNMDKVKTVDTNIVKINIVSDNIDDVKDVANNITAITGTWDNISYVRDVSNNISRVKIVGNDIANQYSYIDDLGYVNESVEGGSGTSNIKIVADNIDDVNTVADNIDSINNASDNFLSKADNLSDLTDASAARDNLSVYSKSEVDSKITPNEILEKVKQVDGGGSGLDADKLDGKEASEFSLSNHQHDDRYYTESEIDTKLSNKADVNHSHSLVNDVNIDGDKDWNGKNITNLKSIMLQNNIAGIDEDGNIIANSVEADMDFGTL